MVICYTELAIYAIFIILQVVLFKALLKQLIQAKTAVNIGTIEGVDNPQTSTSKMHYVKVIFYITTYMLLHAPFVTVLTIKVADPNQFTSDVLEKVIVVVMVVTTIFPTLSTVILKEQRTTFISFYKRS